MYRAKETKKKHTNVWTNKSFNDYQKGTLPNVLNGSGKKTQPNSEPKTFQKRNSYLGQRTYQKSKTSQEWMTHQKPRSYQAQKYNQGEIYNQGQTNKQELNFNNSQKTNQWQNFKQDQKFKHLNQGPKSYQGPKFYDGPKLYDSFKSYRGPRTYHIPRIYPGQEAFKKPMKDYYYSVPEITVSELCRTLTGLKAMEEAKNTNPKDNSAQANTENGKSQPNEPFFASNLEYYPHLPQVYYSEEYQTFAELKASVCKGDLTQVKPPIDNDYHFISEWREANMTPEQRKAYLRNQRALTAQRIGRHERLQRELEGPQEPQAQESSWSEGTAKAPPKHKHHVQDWLNTCKQVEQQRKFRLQQAMHSGFYMRDWRGMRLETRRQELEKEQDLKKPQQEQKERKKQKEPEACFFAEQKKLSTRQMKQNEKEKEKENKLQEIEELNQKEKEEQQKLGARIQRQEAAPEFVAQLQKEFEEQKLKEEDDARCHSEQKKQLKKETKLEVRCKEHDLIQARLRNKRAKTDQQVARETRRYYEQRPFDFRFGPKEDMDLADLNHVTSEHLPKMPTVPRAPVPSQLPQFNGIAPTGAGNGTESLSGN